MTEESREERESRYSEIMRSRSDPSTFYALLDMRIESLGEGSSRMVMPVDSRLFNSGGVLHGGALASIADASIAAALATLIDHDREMMATVEMKINYMAPVRGGDIVCESRIIQKGKSVAVGESSLYSGEGKLLAKATATFLVRERAREI
jgi:uncharacterized protein (TIGR00369 family)